MSATEKKEKKWQDLEMEEIDTMSKELAQWLASQVMQHGFTKLELDVRSIIVSVRNTLMMRNTN